MSKFLSLVLRHAPETIGIELDEAGWTDVELLVLQCKQKFSNFSHEELHALVAESDKQRFSFNADNTKIRASQGHSIPITLGYLVHDPPELLYHGTVQRFVASIGKAGLRKQKRHHVHLSADTQSAVIVGKRRGPPIVLTVHAQKMVAAGKVFYRSDNGVWLTDSVPPVYITFPEE